MFAAERVMVNQRRSKTGKRFELVLVVSSKIYVAVGLLIFHYLLSFTFTHCDSTLDSKLVYEVVGNEELRFSSVSTARAPLNTVREHINTLYSETSRKRPLRMLRLRGRLMAVVLSRAQTRRVKSLLHQHMVSAETYS